MFYVLLPAWKVCQRVQRSDWHLDIIFSILNLIFTHFFKYFVHTFLYWLSSYRSLIFILKWSDAQPSACHTRYHQINCQITGGGDFTKPFYHKTRLDRDILFFSLLSFFHTAYFCSIISTQNPLNLCKPPPLSWLFSPQAGRFLSLIIRF